MNKTTWRSFGRMFRGHQRTIVLALVTSVAQSALFVPVALLIQNVFDHQIPEKDTGGLVVTGALILCLYMGSALLGLWTRYCVLKVTKASITSLRGDLLERVYTLPRAWFDRHSVGTLQSTIVQDSERLDVLANASVGVLPSQIILVISLSTILAVLNPVLFGVLMAVVPLMVLMARWLGKRLRVRVRRWQEAFDVFSTQTQMTLRSMTMVKVQGAEDDELEKRRVEQQDLGKRGLEMGWMAASFGIVQSFVSGSAGVLVLVLGGRAVAHGDMTLGGLISFYALLAVLLRSLSNMMGTLPAVLSGYEYMARLDAILSAEEREPYTGARKVNRPGTIELENVSFGYSESEPLLHEVSLRIERGDHIALFGPNGAGKSTMVNLMLGLYKPTSGRVLLDGVPFDEFDIRSLRRRFGVVLQDPMIFPGTIAQNIAYGHPDATLDDVKRAAEWATASSFIEQMPNGYDTDVGDDGTLVSGGQRQRIAIARALVAQPSVLILDEPTTYLDDKSIRRLLANLADFPGAPSVLIISHDPEVARSNAVVHHLRDGRIVLTEDAGDTFPVPAEEVG